MEEIEDFQDLANFKFNEVKVTYNLRKRENPLLLGKEFLIGKQLDRSRNMRGLTLNRFDCRLRR
jgi:hypothetical protein